MLAEIDDIMRGRWRQSFAPGLVPWIADVSGGDVGVALELLERLPNEGEINDETLHAAVRHAVARGMRCRDIRESVSKIDDYNLAASRATGDDHKKSAESRDEVAAKMTPQQIAEAQKLAREWVAAFEQRQKTTP